MSACVIAQLTVTDPEGFEANRQAAEKMVETFGDRFLVHGSTVSALEGESERPQVILLEFANNAAAERFHTSPEYQAIRPMRLNHATGTVMVVEGGL